jgi:hypothetical protein
VTLEHPRGIAQNLSRRGVEALAAVPPVRRIEAWIDAVDALLDPLSQERRELMPRLLESSRLSAEGLTEALDVVLGGLSGDGARELASRAEATTTPPRPGYSGVILAGNVPGLAAQSLLPALVAGVPLLFKSASDEPHFAPAILAALARREPALADAFAAVTFSGAESEALVAAFGDAHRLLVYGGGEAIEALRARFGDRLVAQGPKASVALVGGGIDPLLVARKLARDIALFDQRGCLSVQAIYTSLDPSELAEALAWALALEQGRLPPGPIEPETASRVQQLRGEAALRGLEVAELPLAAGTVIVEPRPEFTPSPGLRTVRLHPVPGFAKAVEALAPWRDHLQGAALAGEEAWEQTAALEALGVSRIAPAGELQHADAGWRNGGIDPLELFA